jgi:hypothetical protein
MKQITLANQIEGQTEQGPCLVKVALVWAAYGYGVAMLWQWAPHSAPAQAMVWITGIVLGLGLLLAMRVA